MQNNITGLLLDLDELDFAVILRKLKDFFVKWLERQRRTRCALAHGEATSTRRTPETRRREGCRALIKKPDSMNVIPFHILPWK